MSGPIRSHHQRETACLRTGAPDEPGQVRGSEDGPSGGATHCCVTHLPEHATMPSRLCRQEPPRPRPSRGHSHPPVQNLRFAIRRRTTPPRQPCSFCPGCLAPTGPSDMDRPPQVATFTPHNLMAHSTCPHLDNLQGPLWNPNSFISFYAGITETFINRACPGTLEFSLGPWSVTAPACLSLCSLATSPCALDTGCVCSVRAEWAYLDKSSPSTSDSSLSSRW